MISRQCLLREGFLKRVCCKNLQKGFDIKKIKSLLTGTTIDLMKRSTWAEPGLNLH